MNMLFSENKSIVYEPFWIRNTTEQKLYMRTYTAVSMTRLLLSHNQWWPYDSHAHTHTSTATHTANGILWLMEIEAITWYGSQRRQTTDRNLQWTFRHNKNISMAFSCVLICSSDCNGWSSSKELFHANGLRQTHNVFNINKTLNLSIVFNWYRVQLNSIGCDEWECAHLEPTIEICVWAHPWFRPNKNSKQRALIRLRSFQTIL